MPGRDDVFHLAAFLSSRWPVHRIHRLAERINDAPDDGVADGNFEQAAGGADGVAFLDEQVVAEDDSSDAVFFEIEDLAHDSVFELQEFAGHRVAKAVNARDAVADLDDRADFVDLKFFLVASAISCFRDAGDFSDVNLGHKGTPWEKSFQVSSVFSVQY